LFLRRYHFSPEERRRREPLLESWRSIMKKKRQAGLLRRGLHRPGG
jgi:hypothetical protein